MKGAPKQQEEEESDEEEEESDEEVGRKVGMAEVWSVGVSGLKLRMRIFHSVGSDCSCCRWRCN